MTGTVDFRRFRTWDAEPALTATPTWRILVRYGYIRLASSWAGRSLLTVLALAIVVTVGGISYAFAGGVGVQASAWSGAFSLFAWPLAAILLMVGSPLFADDLRFNAPLFYFSKPVRVGDYFAGKLAFLGSLVGAAVLLPILVLLLLALVVGVPVGHPDDCGGRYSVCSADEALRYDLEWRQTHIDSVTEWAGAAAATIPGMVLVIALFTSLAVACSVFTRRGWHAGMAFVAIVGGTGIAGGVLSDSLRGAYGNLASPLGWTYLIVAMPMRLMFARTPVSSYEQAATRGAATAIPLAYAFALAVTVLAIWLSYSRLSRQEGQL